MQRFFQQRFEFSLKLHPHSTFRNSIPDFFKSTIFTIWSLQSSFLNLSSRNIQYVKELSKFRAAYDFFHIRSLIEPDLKEYELPLNWTKLCKRRKSGNTWDVYITHGSSGKRFRSNVAIDDYLTNNPEVKCNRELTNCKYTYQA